MAEKEGLWQMDRNRIINKLAKATIQADKQRTTYQVSKELGRGGNGVAFVVKSATKELVAKFYIPPDARDLDESALKRFQREADLTAKVDHPYVLASEGIGTATVGAYKIPFYLMRRASKTWRELLPHGFGIGNLRELKTFLRVAQGVSYLHHKGIVHRDLKPPNVLIFDGIPKVSDLGIAHVMPESTDDSLLTLPAERLMNKDYYAPEQRHGDATKVNARADIYALGCILYELLSGISPTRPNLPPLAVLDKRLEPLDKILSRMMAHDPQKRYRYLDEAIEAIFWARLEIGDVPDAAPSTSDTDEALLRKLLGSNNRLHQEEAIKPALRLGQSALPILHEALGSRRLDVSSTAYEILGEIVHESSIPYLVSGLYPRRTSSKPRFPTGKVAALAIRKYSPDVRLNVLDTISDLVRPEDISQIIEGLDSKQAFNRVVALESTGRFFSDFDTESVIGLLLTVDENAAWPRVEEQMSHNKDFYIWRVLKEIYPRVNIERKKAIISHFLAQPSSLGSWNIRKLVEVIVGGELPDDFVVTALDGLPSVAQRAIKKYDDREEFEKYLRIVKAKWETTRKPPL
ncbi:serine/threonine-protein kinase [Acidicapsa ligni]|uniref:serine/threonine-protein kinase n=1 Tax=Acidicapsa ligni TaxID=542300 RepID=UPI0021DFC529|nr:serine/threonine-protein kinase [Acidicapsa ligni]